MKKNIVRFIFSFILVLCVAIGGAVVVSASDYEDVPPPYECGIEIIRPFEFPDRDII